MPDGAEIDTAQLNCSTQTCFVLCYKRLSNVTDPSSAAGWDWCICLSCLRALARRLAPRPEEEALLMRMTCRGKWDGMDIEVWWGVRIRFTASSAPRIKAWFVFVNNSLLMHTFSFQTTDHGGILSYKTSLFALCETSTNNASASYCNSCMRLWVFYCHLIYNT